MDRSFKSMELKWNKRRRSIISDNKTYVHNTKTTINHLP